MKRHFLLIISCLCCLTNWGQSILNLSTGKFCDSISNKPLYHKSDMGDSIIITYDFLGAEITEDDLFSGSIWWKYDGFCNNHTSGEASLPIKFDTFTTSENQTVSISIIETTHIDYNYELTPARQPLPDNMPTSYTKDNVAEINEFSGFFPENIVEIDEVQTLRNTSTYWVKISPVQYDHSNKIVRAYTRIKYKVTFTSTPKSRLSDYEITPMPILQDTITQNYLIISTNEFSSAVDTIAAWKRLLGYNVTIALNDTWTTDEVKDEVKGFYRHHADHHYALIIGDHDDVPSNISTLDPTNNIGTQHLTDLYYGCFGGSGDYFPEVHIGRLSVSSLDEANIVVNKIIDYEKTPPLNPSFYNSGVNCSYFQDDNNDTYEDRLFVKTSESIRNKLISNGKTVERIYNTNIYISPRYYSDGNSIPTELLKPGFSWDGDYTDIINSINSGKFYVLHRGHGGVSFWDKPRFTASNIANLSNGKLLPVVFSINCSTGAFDSDCFAEEFLRKGNGGCVGIFAASATSFSPYNDYLASCMFSNVWPASDEISPEFHLGPILNNSLFSMATNSNATSDMRRYQCEIYHCFGDPSMQIHTEQPTEISNIYINRGTESISVSLSGENRSEYIAFNNTFTGEKLLIKGPHATFKTRLPEYVNICVYNHNKTPYIDMGKGLDFFEPPITLNIDCSISNASPNPTTGLITFECSVSENPSDAKIVISDIYGNAKTSVTIPEGTQTVTTDLSPIENGIYVATLIVNGISKDSKRIVVQK